MWVDGHARAILWAQWRALWNRMGRGGRASAGIAIFVTVLWYGFVALGAVLLAIFLPAITSRTVLTQGIAMGLFLAFLYWQLIPVALASGGMALDLKKLRVYPIPDSRMFSLEVLLRVSTGIEVLILLAGTAVGLWRSALVPWWGPLWLIPYAGFNMVLSAGVRDLLTRLLARRGVRELVVFGIVLISALPQLFLSRVTPEQWRNVSTSPYLQQLPHTPLPWAASAVLATGEWRWGSFLSLAVWIVLGVWFGYSQFQRGLRWDADEVRSKQRDKASPKEAGWKERLYRIPSALLPGILGVLVEKEIRFLTRAPRFRLVFFMGFSFGLIIWLPLLLRRKGPGFFSDNLLLWVMLYAALLLGEVLFWNCFGFDRQAAQAYFVMPVRMSTVLISKNITALLFLMLEAMLVTAAVLLLQVKIPPEKILESFTVAIMFSLFLLAIGNLASVRYPRPINPNQSWRNTSGAPVQLLLILIYPMLLIPVGLAYLARFAFDSSLAFYAVILASMTVGAITYHVSMRTSVELADARKEEFVSALSQGEGPVE